MHPEKMKSLKEVVDTLSKIDHYERTLHCRGGVLIIQNRQFGSALYLISREEAEYELTKPVLSSPRTTEWGLAFYPRQYFEALRDRLQKKGGSCPLPEPLKRE